MSIFSKPVSDISASDLRELLDDKAVENLRLEFKREIPDKDETLKKLSSFANTMGGVVIIGATAQSSDGRVEALNGVESKPGYKQTLVQWCFEGVSPPLDVDVSDAIAITGEDGRVCYVVGVAESDRGPHFLNGRKGVYVRTNEFSSRFEARLANENELRHLLQRRQLVRERRASLIQRARNRFETFTIQKYGELGQPDHNIGARFDLSIGPRFPAHPLCEHGRLLSIIETTSIAWRQVGFPRTTGGGVISQHESALSLRPGSSFSILEANIWGMLFYATEIETQTPRANADVLGVHSYHFIGHVLAFLEHCGVVLSGLSYNGPLSIEMKLDAIRGKPWITFEGGLAYAGPSSMLDDTVLFSFETTADELTRTRDALAISILRYVFFATNLNDVAANVGGLEAYVRGGYLYNMWGTPTTLRV